MPLWGDSQLQPTWWLGLMASMLEASLPIWFQEELGLKSQTTK